MNVARRMTLGAFVGGLTGLTVFGTVALLLTAVGQYSRDNILFCTVLGVVIGIIIGMSLIFLRPRPLTAAGWFAVIVSSIYLIYSVSRIVSNGGYYGATNLALFVGSGVLILAGCSAATAAMVARFFTALPVHAVRGM